ncbi:ribonuclease H1-like isoform X1 [Bufo bufo]|uniref:ribonuclease H1-like isoform X1 n=1 Tax=Bufo bufo TaxID=8384 RepID=UPI001ABE1B0D|nr:ribonuclease H1-like isoform X1 [Bufo bufo]
MYYAVRSGRQPGVYSSWDECRTQVNRYPSARYKKFPTYEQAQHFIRAADYPSNSSCGQAERSATVYTDGSCSRNGRYGAQAGIGVYWGPNHPLNVSERLYGRQTNQRAEIEAASRAVEQARDHNVTRLNVCTDSEYTIKGMTEWVPRWKKNNWMTLYGEEVVNKEEFESLDNLCKELDVQWTQVQGHRGNPGNEKADRLARQGARKRSRK